MDQGPTPFNLRLPVAGAPGQRKHPADRQPGRLYFCLSGETANFNSSGALVTSSGSDYASYMLGMIDSASITQNAVAETGGRYKTSAPYVQDNIQVTPKLTVNLGLRGDVWSPFTEVHNYQSFFNPNLANPAAGNIFEVCNLRAGEPTVAVAELQ